MSVLEAMSVGLPVVVTADCGLAPLVERTQQRDRHRPERAGVGSRGQIDPADPSLAHAMGERGRQPCAPNSACAPSVIGSKDVYTELVEGTAG